MSQFNIKETVGELVMNKPGLARVFERLGIDYCCGGKMPLEYACREQSLDPQEVLGMLEEEVRNIAGSSDLVDVSDMPLTELADHIESTHHAFLRTEFPRLLAMTEKVASVHGEHDSRLHEVHEVMQALVAELMDHMMKEEQILFPMIRQFAAGELDAASHCGSVAAPINQMEAEHAIAGTALARLQQLTDDHTPPEWACNTYRAMLDGLQRFEFDLHQHIHKESNVLFPRAIKLEVEGSAKLQ